MWGDKGSFGVQVTVHRQGKLGRELTARTWKQALKQRPWKNGPYWLAQLAFSYNSVSPAQGAHLSHTNH